MSVNTRQEFLDLLFLYKQKLVPHLPPLEVSHISISKTVTNHPSLPRVKVTHTYTVNKPAQAAPPPTDDTIGDATVNFSVYSLAELWSAVTKHFAAQRIANPSFASKVRWLGQRVKMTLTRENSGVTVILPGGRATIRVTTEEIAKWVTIDKAVLGSLTRKEKKEWSILCAIIVVTRGGTKLPAIPETPPEDEVAGPESHSSNSDADTKSCSSSVSIVSFYSTDGRASDNETLHSHLQRTDLRGIPPSRSARQPESVTPPQHILARPKLEGLQGHHIRFQESPKPRLESKPNATPPVPVRPAPVSSTPKPEKLGTSRAQPASPAIVPRPRAQTRAVEDLDHRARARVRARDPTELVQPFPASSSSTRGTHGHLPFRYNAGTTANDIIHEVQLRGRMIYRDEVIVETVKQEVRTTTVYERGNSVTSRRGLDGYRTATARSNSYIAGL